LALLFLFVSPKSKGGAYSNSHYKNRFFESPPAAGFQKTDFSVAGAYGAGNTKIGFIMRIAVALSATFTFWRQ
jgi:hypothetical protein